MRQPTIITFQACDINYCNFSLYCVLTGVALLAIVSDVGRRSSLVARPTSPDAIFLGLIISMPTVGFSTASNYNLSVCLSVNLSVWILG
jgi:hypothetical protein